MDAPDPVIICPKCGFVLNEGDQLSHRIGNSHYCPTCWTLIERPPQATTGDEETDEALL